MPWFAHFCTGWPRAKQNPGNWIDETKTYLWDIQGAMNSGDTHACHPLQRSPTYYTATSSPPNPKNLGYHENPAPMVTAAAGTSIKLMFGGNGHSRGAPMDKLGDPGRVSVYWAGEKEREIVDVKEFTSEYLVQEDGFSDESFSFPADMNIKSSGQGLIDKGNWMTLRLPECMEQGRHMMVWVWSFQGMDRFSTCFDVMVQ
jgi:hypothetical protein